MILSAYIFAVRPWFICWGATEAEFNETLPGDELVSHPKHHDTHAITIHAPISEVWAWLVQIGQNKGGFYGYTSLENLVGCHMHNADRVIAEYQTLKIGDPVRLHPDAPPLTAIIVEFNSAIVLVNEPDVSVTPPAFNGTWGFYVRHADSASTRLLVRSRWAWNSGFLSWIGYRCFLEPAHFIMERKMLLNIKAHAEYTS